MKIQYLKQMHNANVGDVLEVTEFEANVLVRTGVAKLIDEPKKAATKSKKQEDTDQ